MKWTERLCVQVPFFKTDRLRGTEAHAYTLREYGVQLALYQYAVTTQLVQQHEIVAYQTDGKTLTDVAKNRVFTTPFHVGALLGDVAMRVHYIREGGTLALTRTDVASLLAHAQEYVMRMGTSVTLDNTPSSGISARLSKSSKNDRLTTNLLSRCVVQREQVWST